MRKFGVPALAEIPASVRLTDTVVRRAGAEPDVVVLRKRTGAGVWQDVTAAEFGAEVAALAGGLIAAGIGPGDRVALMSRTRYEWTLIDYAIWTTGATVVPVYEPSSAEQAEWILSDSGARACFAETAAFEQVIEGFRDRVPALEHVWRIEPGAEASLSSLTEAGAGVEDQVIAERAGAAKAADLATVIYTSG